MRDNSTKRPNGVGDGRRAPSIWLRGRRGGKVPRQHMVDLWFGVEEAWNRRAEDRRARRNSQD